MPDGNLQNLRERLEKAKERVSGRVVGPIRQAFTEAVQHITTRVESQTALMTGKSQSSKSEVTPDTTESITDEEISLEVNLTARGIATSEYGDSQNRPTGVVRQEALGLQITVEQVLKDILKEA